MAVKLHRCSNLWAKFGPHPCWRVQKALDAQGIEYEIVPGPWPSRKTRTAVLEGTGQALSQLSYGPGNGSVYPHYAAKSVNSGSRFPRSSARSTSTQRMPRDSASVTACGLHCWAASMPRQASFAGSSRMRAR